MTISGRFARRALGAVALLLGLGVAGGAQAVPVYSYTFTQTGYTPLAPYVSAPATVTGSFSGTLDSTGRITRNTLTAYHFEISGFDGPQLAPLTWSNDAVPYFFSYIPEDTGSFGLLDIGGRLNAFHMQVCIGAPAALKCHGGSAPGVVALSLFDVGNTASVLAAAGSAPVLIGSVFDIGDPVYLATTPIPGAALLFGSALAMLGFGAIRRRSAAASSAA